MQAITGVYRIVTYQLSGCHIENGCSDDDGYADDCVSLNEDMWQNAD